MDWHCQLQAALSRHHANFSAEILPDAPLSPAEPEEAARADSWLELEIVRLTLSVSTTKQTHDI